PGVVEVDDAARLVLADDVGRGVDAVLLLVALVFLVGRVAPHVGDEELADLLLEGHPAQRAFGPVRVVSAGVGRRAGVPRGRGFRTRGGSEAAGHDEQTGERRSGITVPPAS